MNDYPYFLYPVISELRYCRDPRRRSRLYEIIAANVGDPDALRALIGNPETDLRNFYPRGNQDHSTEDTIDSFIARFGDGPAPAILADDLLSCPLPEPVPEPDDVTDEEPEEVTDEEPESEPEGNGPDGEQEMRDTLEKVKILVKNRDYKGALAIMEAIYLNNPKKSVYFADQIRFVRKMMLNESLKH